MRMKVETRSYLVDFGVLRNKFFKRRRKDACGSTSEETPGGVWTMRTE